LSKENKSEYVVLIFFKYHSQIILVCQTVPANKKLLMEYFRIRTNGGSISCRRRLRRRRAWRGANPERSRTADIK
jgi:hypothetical protein